MAPKRQSQRGNNQQPVDDDDDDDVDFTPRQLEVMNNQINATVSAIVTRKLKPFQDQLSVLPNIQETLEKIAGGNQGGAGGQQQQQQGQQGGNNGGGQQGQQRLEDHPEFIAMKRRDQQREQERQAERLEARNNRRDTQLTELATAAGVDKNRVRGVVALLRDQVKYDKDGNPFMMVKRNGLDEEVDVEAGTKDFFGSDEGKSYLAPVQQQQQRGGQQRQQQTQQQRGTNAASVVRGAGAGGQGNNNPVQSQQQQNRDKVAAAREQLRQGVQQLLGDGTNIDIS